MFPQTNGLLRSLVVSISGTHLFDNLQIVVNLLLKK